MGYYDRLEVELDLATQRGVQRRHPGRRTERPRPLGDWLAGAVAVAITAVVALAFIGIRPGDRLVHPHIGTGLPAVRNYAPGRAPRVRGQLVCNADLGAPGQHGRARGVVDVRIGPTAHYLFSIVASGLPWDRGRNTYELWLRPATTTVSGGYELLRSSPPQFLGLIRPGIGREGRLNAEGVVPQALNGAYLLMITVQAHPSATLVGRPVLEGFIGL